MSFMREQGAYRRGMVLGLTFAEVMLLLLFVLLIALSFFLQRKEKEVQDIQNNLSAAQEQVEALTVQLEAANGNRLAIQKFNDTFKELKLAQEQLKTQASQIKEQNNQIATLSDAFRELEIARSQLETQASQIKERDNEIAALSEATTNAEQMMEKAEAWDRLSNAFPGAMDPSSVMDQIKVGAQNQAVADAVEGSGLPSNPEELSQKLNDLKELEFIAKQALGDKAKAEDQLEYFRRRAGLSNELPPCWISADTSQAEYIFDVSLGSDGMRVYLRPPDYRKPELEELPLDGVIYESPADVRTFQKMFRPLYDWSESNKCRFFVRAFDRTEAHEKELFKSQLRTTEGFFYKYLVSDRSIRPGETDG